MSGKVFLIGAGPGDAGLLTQKGARILSEAEVVVYDRLVGEGVLALMPREAELINVGKQVANHPVPQYRINEILLEKAQQGKRVVRLKGGDCFLFGRGGEELELLTEHGIPFEVVPGVPSPIAATAYAGIPITHRDFCSSVHFITGHKKQDGELQLDYEALTRLNGTLVFMMSVASCPEIAAGLIAAGMDAAMPCAIIENGTRLEQRKVVTTLSELGEAVTAHRIVSPALIVVGKVCTLSDRFDWFTTLPLHGVRILVTAPAGSTGRLSQQLSALGAAVTALPAIETRPLAFDLPDLTGVKLLCFTSAAGVTAYFDRLFRAGLDARALGGVRIAAVGAATAASLRQYGLVADWVPPVYSGEALANELLQNGFLVPGDTALLLRAREAAPELPTLLSAAGVRVRETAVYETLPLSMGSVDPSGYACVTFTSKSCVDSFHAACTAGNFINYHGIHALCIGEKTADAARALGMQVQVSQQATIDSMVNSILEAYQA